MTAPHPRHHARRTRPRLVHFVLYLLPLLAACAGAPAMLGTHGAQARRLEPLGWTLLVVAAAVVLAVSVVLLGALLRARPDHSTRLVRTDPHSGLRWITVGGIILPTLILIAVFTLTMRTLAATAMPPRSPRFAIQVIGHRWWWEVRYHGTTPEETFLTADEIRVPTGVPVRIELDADDVIHSFWVPQLAGKIDMIPGQRNVTWIQADTPGVYRGECAEFCGLQHTKMDFAVVAQRPDEFRTWLARQYEPGAMPTDALTTAGQSVFLRNACSACHAIRGTDALARLGPDLTHFASRRTIGAGVLPNTPGGLAGWISNAQALKPGNDMPPMPLSARDLNAVVGYLESLR